jgi:hypothetical protein
LASWLFVNKQLRRGEDIATSNHLVAVFERFEPHQHRYNKKDVYRHDRQDVAGPTRMSGLAARACLEKMQSNHADTRGQQHPPERTQATIDFLELMSCVIRIHFSPPLTNEQRIELASFVLNDLRFWRNHVHYTPGLKLTENFMSRQSFEHCCLQMHSACLHIKMIGQVCPSQPTDLGEVGSDPCERAFANFGGAGVVQGRTKNYDVLQALEAAADLNQLGLWAEGEQDDALRLSYGNGPSHLFCDIGLHEAAGLETADLTIHPSAAAQYAAFDRGLARARQRAVDRKMSLAGELSGTALTGEDLMARPWLGEGQLVRLMKEEEEEEADGGAGGGGEGGGGEDGGGEGGGGEGGGGEGGGGEGGSDEDGGDDGDSDGDAADGSSSALLGPPGSRGGGCSEGDPGNLNGDAAAVVLDAVEEAVLQAEPVGAASAAAPPPASAPQKTTPLMTVTRGGQAYRVYKRTYLHEAQQEASGIRLPTSRLEKVAAAAKQTQFEVARARASAALGGEEGESELMESSEPTLGIGSNVAIATVTDGGQYEWWAGRVQQMLRKSEGKRGRYGSTVLPVLYDEAVRLEIKVVCNWYTKRVSKGEHTFGYWGGSRHTSILHEARAWAARLRSTRRERCVHPARRPAVLAAG